MIATPDLTSRRDSGRGTGMSLLNAMYYVLKPLLPTRLRYSIRRLRARYKLLAAKDWPIMEAAAKPPTGWAGWPDHKEFAFVLTHDVEGLLGVRRCPALADLEAKLGFRASFNFIPEGEYSVTSALRNHLVAEGFEVGVHDLRHDGSLYRSRAAFTEAAQRINHYLEEWNAVGFRAGFMFHNLDWLRQLRIEYDASTFDTDPFEPQPDGVGTIFPFWVPRHEPGDGYVELPYTLAQDSTLFLILREKALDTWIAKLDWVAAHGGMALLNVHPDYVALDGRPPRHGEFGADLYERFLTYVQDRYGHCVWHALPRDVARFYRTQHLHLPRPQSETPVH